MAVTSLIFGEREDIKIKHGDYFDGHTFTITDSAGVAYTFPDNVTALDLKFYDFNGGTQIGTTIDLNNGLSRSSAVITWSSTYAIWDSNSITKPTEVYYYELTLTTTTGSKHLTIADGYATLV